MIGISKLYMGTVEPSDALRYGRKSKLLPSHLLQFSKDKKPVVVWNCTKRCNLKCKHCYSTSDNTPAESEMSHEQGKALIDDLAEYGSPVLLFSGGEPLVRQDMPDLAEYAISKGMRAVISTNGTLIDDSTAQRLKKIGLSYVGISLDGIGKNHDTMRCKDGAFDAAMRGIEACKKVGLKVGLRHTITKENYLDIPEMFTLLEKKDIPRICFYHLAYSGRGKEIADIDLGHEGSRKVVDQIMDLTADLHRRGLKKEVLTVDNHCDGAYLYMRMVREGNPRAEQVMELLQMNGGNSTGNGIGCVSWDGTVYPDQFWRTKPLGNVLEKPFSEIWSDRSNPLVDSLKDKFINVTGKCVKCKFLTICGGNFRSRAEAVTGDVWGVDPACYLTNSEIGLV